MAMRLAHRPTTTPKYGLLPSCAIPQAGGMRHVLEDSIAYQTRLDIQRTVYVKRCKQRGERLQAFTSSSPPGKIAHLLLHKAGTC